MLQNSYRIHAGKRPYHCSMTERGFIPSNTLVLHQRRCILHRNHRAVTRTQIGAMMEVIAKAAMAEINRCVDDSCAVFRLEISQSQKDIETLKHKLIILERELLDARKTETESIFAQQLSLKPRGSEDRTAVENVDCPSKPRISRNQSRCEGLPVKQERPEEDICFSDELLISSAEDHVTQTMPIEDGKKPDTEPTHVRDPEVLWEQHRCGHGDEELSGLEFVVKAEQEEDEAQRLNQTGCDLHAGRLNTLGSECVLYERDNRLWSSCVVRDSDLGSVDPVCSDATEQSSRSLSIQSPIHLMPAPMEVSGSTLTSPEDSYAEFDGMGEGPSACSEELRSEAIHTRQGQYRERLVHTVERENQTLLPQQQQHGPTVKHRRGSEIPAQPHTGSQYETGARLSTGAVNTGEMGETDGEKPFVCKYCGKRFSCGGYLVVHYRVHTGEKPYSCAHCGRCFSCKSNLARHEMLHGTYRPYACTQCGKSFARRTHLRGHLRTHTGERPFHCSQCGKSFTRRHSLVVHQQKHSEVKLLS